MILHIVGYMGPEFRLLNCRFSPRNIHAPDLFGLKLEIWEVQEGPKECRVSFYIFRTFFRALGGDLVSSLRTPVNHIVALVIPCINLLIKSPDPRSTTHGFWQRLRLRLSNCYPGAGGPHGS